jgi:cell division protein FtsW
VLSCEQEGSAYAPDEGDTGIALQIADLLSLTSPSGSFSRWEKRGGKIIRVSRCTMKPLHPLLLSVQLVLLALGVLATATASPDNVMGILVFAGVGLFVTFFVAQLRANASVSIGKYGWILCLAALAGVLLFGNEINGVKRWISIGGFQLQPSEFAKVALIAYFASFFARRGSRYALWVPVAALGMTAGLILLAPSTSAAVFTFTLGLGVMFIANVPLGRVISVALFAGLVAFLFIGIYLGRNPYVVDRITGVTSTRQVADLCYKPDKSQVEFARCVIERGGAYGRGPAQAKYNFFADTTDLVSSTVAHTLGLLGVTVIFAAFACLVLVGFDLMKRLDEALHIDVDERNAARVLCGGAMMMLVGQAVINLGVTVGRFPNTGMTLPFVSDGGSSMVACAIAMGWMHVAHALLVKHAKKINKRKKALEPKEALVTPLQPATPL